MGAKKLSYKKFLESLKLAPRLTVEILIEGDNSGIFLLKRVKLPFENYWYLPGGFLLRGEMIEECVERLSREELGFRIDFKKGEFAGLFENLDGDPRGHLLHYVLRFRLDGLPEEIREKGRFFSKLPKLTIPYQKNFLRKLGYR